MNKARANTMKELPQHHRASLKEKRGAHPHCSIARDPQAAGLRAIGAQLLNRSSLTHVLEVLALSCAAAERTVKRRSVAFTAAESLCLPSEAEEPAGADTEPRLERVLDTLTVPPSDSTLRALSPETSFTLAQAVLEGGRSAAAAEDEEAPLDNNNSELISRAFGIEESEANSLPWGSEDDDEAESCES